jgi:L-xylulose reductase
MPFDFSGKRALVTGAGKGIGRATVRSLVECGAEVVALSRTEADLVSLKEEIPGVQTVCVDLSDIVASVDAVKSLGPIHLLVNNAGITKLEPFLEVTTEAFDSIFSVNVKSVLFLSQVIAKGMMERGEGGSIVNVSSQASQAALLEHSVYCASKGALDMLTSVMGMELGPHGIRVNAVNPTVVLTKMGKQAWSDPVKAEGMLSKIPMRKFAEEEDIVNAILFLLSDKSAMINCTKLPIDGGFLAC